jgi:hypothetical protein
MLAATYAIATCGLLVLAFDSVLFDRVATVIWAAIVLALLVWILVTGWGWAWLAVAALWLYEVVIVAVRATYPYQRAGLALICFAIAVGALTAYVASDRDYI